MSNIVNIREEITQFNMLTLQEAINAVISKNEKVTIQLCSAGGDISAAMMLYYYLQEQDTKLIEIKVVNNIASACSLFLFTKHKTTAYPHISVMFHPVSSTVTFAEKSQENVINCSKHRINQYWDIFISKLGEEKVNTFRSIEEYYYVEDLLSLGIITEET